MDTYNLEQLKNLATNLAVGTGIPEEHKDAVLRMVNADNEVIGNHLRVLRQINLINDHDERSFYDKFSDDKEEWGYELRFFYHHEPEGGYDLGKPTPKWLEDLNGTRNAKHTTAYGTIVAYNDETGETAECYGGVGGYVDADTGEIEFGGMFAKDCWGGRCAYTGRTYWGDYEEKTAIYDTDDEE